MDCDRVSQEPDRPIRLRWRICIVMRSLDSQSSLRMAGYAFSFVPLDLAVDGVFLRMRSDFYVDGSFASVEAHASRFV